MYEYIILIILNFYLQFEEYFASSEFFVTLQGGQGITRFKAFSITAMEATVLLCTTAKYRDWTPSTESRDRKSPYARCWEEFIAMNEWDRDSVKLLKVKEAPRKNPKAPVENVWVTFSATERTLFEIQRERYEVFHVSSTDKEVHIIIEHNARQKEAKLLKELSSQRITELLVHRG